ncbi:MAG TPA: VanW family protein [Candidatus Limnocylindrales bacterium]|nr:VanW family protein [Candidatus Limnocylindrales bacterium]
MTDELTSPLAGVPADAASRPIPVDDASEAIDRRRHRPWARFFVAFLISMLLGLAAGAGALYAYDREYTGRVLPGVAVAGLDLSGLTPEQATEQLEAAYAYLGQGKAIVAGGGFEMPIDYAKIGRRADVERMVTEAMAVGRSGNAVERVILDARTAVRGYDIQPAVVFDEARLARYVQTYAARLTITPKSAIVVERDGAFEVVPGSDGRVADRIAPTEYLTAALADLDAPSEIRVDLEVAAVDPDVTNAEASAAVTAANTLAADIPVVAGKESWTIPTAVIHKWITFSTGADGTYGPVISDESMTASLTSTLAEEVAIKGRNASFSVSGGKITGVVPGKDGRGLDVAQTASRVSEVLKARATGAAETPVEPVLISTPPNLTTAEAQAVAGKMRKISSWTTYFPITEKNGFGNNIWIPALDIDGYVVGPHEKFDFWGAVGPITRARGYRDGGAIINGKTEPQGALAGGICSCSTTLFNAALRAGFEMGARRNHYYYIDRYPLGLDATVFKSGSGSVQTMSWTNDTDYPVLIRGYKIRDGGRGYVRFELYSVPNGRKVSFSRPIVKNVRPATDTVQYTSTLAPGTRKRIEYPVDGKDVWVTRTVRDASGKVIHQETYYSHYARITGITLVGR